MVVGGLYHSLPLSPRLLLKSSAHILGKALVDIHGSMLQLWFLTVIYLMVMLVLGGTLFLRYWLAVKRQYTVVISILAMHIKMAHSNSGFTNN